MIAIAGNARFLGKLFLLALAFLVVTVVQDGPKVSADHSRIIIADSASSVTHLTNIFFSPDSSARTVYVRAINVTHDATGVAAFDVVLRFDPDIAVVTSIVPDATWLATNGRSAFCTDPTDPTNPGIRPVAGNTDGLWEAWLGCITLGAAPPFGATGNGLLATVVLEPGPSFGGFTLRNGSALFNTTANVDEIAVTKRDTGIILARCADVNPPEGDGFVSGGDISIIVLAFGLTTQSSNWNADWDLDNNGAIGGSDISLVVLQFGQECPE